MQGRIPGVDQTVEHDARTSNHWHSQIGPVLAVNNVNMREVTQNVG